MNENRHAVTHLRLRKFLSRERARAKGRDVTKVRIGMALLESIDETLGELVTEQEIAVAKLYEGMERELREVLEKEFG